MSKQQDPVTVGTSASATCMQHDAMLTRAFAGVACIAFIAVVAVATFEIAVEEERETANNVIETEPPIGVMFASSGAGPTNTSDTTLFRTALVLVDFLGGDLEFLTEDMANLLEEAFKDSYNDIYGITSTNQYDFRLARWCYVPCSDGTCCEATVTEFGEVLQCTFECAIQCFDCPSSLPFFPDLENDDGGNVDNESTNDGIRMRAECDGSEGLFCAHASYLSEYYCTMLLSFLGIRSGCEGAVTVTTIERSVIEIEYPLAAEASYYLHAKNSSSSIGTVLVLVDFLGGDLEFLTEDMANLLEEAFKDSYNDIYEVPNQYYPTQVALSCNVPCSDGTCCEATVTEIGEVLQCTFECVIVCFDCQSSVPVFPYLENDDGGNVNNESTNDGIRKRAECDGPEEFFCAHASILSEYYCTEILSSGVGSECEGAVNITTIETSMKEEKKTVYNVIEPPNTIPPLSIHPINNKLSFSPTSVP